MGRHDDQLRSERNARMKNFHNFDRTTNKFFGLAFVIWLIGALLTVGFWAGVLYLVYLLIQKL